jgi:hypothetical protein
VDVGSSVQERLKLEAVDDRLFWVHDIKQVNLKMKKKNLLNILT